VTRPQFLFSRPGRSARSFTTVPVTRYTHLLHPLSIMTLGTHLLKPSVSSNSNESMLSPAHAPLKESNLTLMTFNPRCRLSNSPFLRFSRGFVLAPSMRHLLDLPTSLRFLSPYTYPSLAFASLFGPANLPCLSFPPTSDGEDSG